MRARKPPTLLLPAFPRPTDFQWCAAGLAVLVLAAYWNSLGASFHFDDRVLFNDSHVAGPGFGWKLFRLEQTRSLTYWTFHLNFLAGGTNPRGYHVVNVILHAANAVLMLWIARHHLPRLPAFLAAGLFAVHPLQTEAVTYVFARSSLLATFFALLSFVLFLRRRYAFSAVAFTLSLLAKEETVALPAFLLLYDLGKWCGIPAGRFGPDLTRKPTPGVGEPIQHVEESRSGQRTEHRASPT